LMEGYALQTHRPFDRKGYGSLRLEKGGKGGGNGPTEQVRQLVSRKSKRGENTENCVESWRPANLEQTVRNTDWGIEFGERNAFGRNASWRADWNRKMTDGGDRWAKKQFRNSSQ